MNLSPQNLLDQVQGLGKRFQEEISCVSNDQDLLRLKSAYLGKQGLLALLLKGLGGLSPEIRPQVGQEANRLKVRVEESCRETLQRLEERKKQEKIAGEVVDVTLPGRCCAQGNPHPLQRILEEVEDVFISLGFSIFEGPEVEQDYYNFEALNISAHHPARDMQDTFYISGGNLLRTHTSPVQIHVMENHRPPIRMIAPGAVYRRDSDVSHTPMFHQVEGLVVDKDITFSDLKGTVTLFLCRFFGTPGKIRFRPSYFPFTEPSAEVDLGCVHCDGRGKRSAGSERVLAGSERSVSEDQMGVLRGRAASPTELLRCRLCSGTGWLEVMGCGMVHPAVFRKVGYDPNKVTGFAFGMGIERMAMLRLGIPDIRLFFENDLRFLKQF